MATFDYTDRQLVIAMDHARAMGAVRGLEDPGQVIETVIEAGADGIMASFGTIKHYRGQLIGRLPVYLRLDGGTSVVREPWLQSTEWALLHTVEDAELLGCDGVCLMYFMGAPCELETLAIVAEVASACLKEELPLMVEALPCPHPNIPDPYDAQMMADACRIGFEHGADILKTYYTGSPESFRKVVEGTPGPVLVAGGEKLDSDRAVLEMVAGVMAAGGKGIVMGRNIWQHRDPAAMVRALKAIIHDDASAAQAAELLPA